jgi:hypothetical protein
VLWVVFFTTTAKQRSSEAAKQRSSEAAKQHSTGTPYALLAAGAAKPRIIKQQDTTLACAAYQVAAVPLVVTVPAMLCSARIAEVEFLLRQQSLLRCLTGTTAAAE